MKRHIIFYSVLILTMFLGSSFGQRVRNCSTMDVLERLQRENPELINQMQEVEKDMQQRILERLDKFGINTTQSIRTVPVVVHVVYNNSSQNISEAQIKSQIRILNEDFQKMQNTPGYNNNPVGANTQINFGLATIDPNGNSTNGITRTSTSKSSFTDNDDIKKSSRGGKDAWNTDKYLNIWVGKLGDDILGYAQFPGGPASTDGVVITYDAFGDQGTALYPFDMGRTTTHEVGHYFNLYHIWGDGGCGVDDEVSDTPESDNPNFGCAEGHVSCGSVDMIENYMDYSDDACMNIYTVGQSNRMNAILDGVRNNLVSGVTPPPPTNTAPIANANGPYSGQVGSSIQFSSSESADSDGSIVSYLWNFGDGATSSSANPAHTYSSAGAFQVSLKVTDDDGSSDTENTTAQISNTPPPPSNTAPFADAAGPYNASLGSLVSFNGSGSIDSDGTIVAYSWTFGDGSSSSSKNPSHTYSSVGTYQVKLIVTDNDGYTDQDVTSAEVTQSGGAPEIVFEEGFEFIGSEVPGEIWNAFDNNSGNGRDYWGDQYAGWGAKTHTGDWSLYCSEWSNRDGTTYDNNMNSYAVYRNWINVSKYSHLELSFWMWYKTKNSNDYVTLEVRDRSGSWTEIGKWSGSSGDSWRQYSYRISGYLQLKFRFRFVSDGSGRGDGVYIDDIVVSGLKTINTSKASVVSNAVIEAISVFGRTFEYGLFTAGELKNEERPSSREIQDDYIEVLEAEVVALANYPNPFNPSTTIKISVPEAGDFTLKVYNTLGQEVANLYTGKLEVGNHSFNFDASQLSSGMYIYSIIGSNVNISKKMLLMK